MKPKIEDTDIIIRQAANGWIVFSASGDRGIGSEYEEDHFITTVYEEGETEWGEHEALIHLFHDHFPGYIQSKNRGGIRLEVRVKGYVEEDEDWSEHEGFSLSNKSKLFRDAEEARKKAVSIDME